MSIQRIIKSSLIGVCVILLGILLTNVIAFHKIENNNNDRDHISNVLVMQDRLYELLFDLLSTNSKNGIQSIGENFYKQHADVDLIQKRFLEQHHQRHKWYDTVFTNFTLYKGIEEEFKILLSNQKSITDIFEQLYEKQNRAIDLTTTLQNKSLQEEILYNTIEKSFLNNNHSSINQIKYVRQKALFQYKDEKYFNQFLQTIKLLKHKSKRTTEYWQLIETIKTHTLQIKKMTINTHNLLNHIKIIRNNNRALNNGIQYKIQTINSEFIQFLTIFVLVLITSILFIVSFLGYKIYQNIGISIDTINHKIAQEIEKNRRKDKLLFEQSKLAAMGEMIGNIAHQWRQPLNALAGGIQFLRDDFEDGIIDDAFLENFIQENMQLIQFMSKTIDDFRDFFKTNKIESTFDIKVPIEKTLRILSSQLEKLNITVHIEGENYLIKGVQSEIEQVILNIINNAKDALIENKPSSPTISISTKVNQKHGYISIEDNANGIPDTLINRIFEPYFTTKDEGKGTGLGLYMSQTIIKEHFQGDITVHNTKKGACFIIRLIIDTEEKQLKDFS